MISKDELNSAINEGRFVLHYLPAVNLETSRLVGAEALLRLPVNDGQFLGPEAFLPLAEETGLIVGLGYAVFEMACRQISEWQRSGLAQMTIGVNLSAQQCADPDFDRVYRGILQETGVDTDLLLFEISDTTLTQNPEVFQTLQPMRSIGVKVALDNFGTGMSSVQEIGNMPIDAIKIDRSIVQLIEEDEAVRELITEVIDSAERHNLDVIGEGVETAGQLDFLEAAGCRYVQGFLFDQPIPADRLPSLAQG